MIELKKELYIQAAGYFKTEIYENTQIFIEKDEKRIFIIFDDDKNDYRQRIMFNHASTIKEALNEIQNFDDLDMIEDALNASENFLDFNSLKQYMTEFLSKKFNTCDNCCKIIQIKNAETDEQSYFYCSKCYNEINS